MPMKAATKCDKAVGVRDPKMAAATRASSVLDSPGKESVDSGPDEIAQEVVKLLEPKFDTVMRKLDEMGERFGEVTKRMDEVEQRVNVLEEGELALERAAEKQQKLMDDILLKVDDLENRSRRNNLRLIGVPETWTGGQLSTLFEEWLPHALGLEELRGKVQVERAHRLGPMSEAQDSPRPVLARLLNFQHKNMLLQAYRKKRDLQLDNVRLLLFPDYSASLAARRKAFAPICSMLIERDVKFALIYPATLKIFYKGDSHSFEQATAAKKFVTALPSSAATPRK